MLCWRLTLVGVYRESVAHLVGRVSQQETDPDKQVYGKNMVAKVLDLGLRLDSTVKEANELQEKVAPLAEAEEARVAMEEAARKAEEEAEAARLAEEARRAEEARLAEEEAARKAAEEAEAARVAAEATKRAFEEEAARKAAAEEEAARAKRAEDARLAQQAKEKAEAEAKAKAEADAKAAAAAGEGAKTEEAEAKLKQQAEEAAKALAAAAASALGASSAAQAVSSAAAEPTVASHQLLRINHVVLLLSTAVSLSASDGLFSLHLRNEPRRALDKLRPTLHRPAAFPTGSSRQAPLHTPLSIYRSPPHPAPTPSRANTIPRHPAPTPPRGARCMLPVFSRSGGCAAMSAAVNQRAAIVNRHAPHQERRCSFTTRRFSAVPRSCERS